MPLDLQETAPEGDGPPIEPTMLDSEPAVAHEPAADLAPVAAAAAAAAPVTPEERLASVDTLRGLALLGILAMNIVGFGWPGAAYGDPLKGGGFDGSDRLIWFFNHLVFEEKMMTIFSMLFGAGLVLMGERAAARGASLRGVYYRRVLWLLAIGLVHSYLIWDGDVLVLYAQCGLFLYPFRRLSARALITIGVIFSLILIPIVLGFGLAIRGLERVTARVDAQVAAGKTPTRLDRRLRDLWVDDLQKELNPNPEQEKKDWDESMAVHRGGYAGIVKKRAVGLVFEQTFGFVLGGFFFAMSRMLLGMGLMKLGVFSAERSRAFYLEMVGLGYGIGLPLMVIDARELVRHAFRPEYLLNGGEFYNLFGSLVVAMGHVGLIMLLVQSGSLAWLTGRLAAVGRMALSNYLTHSIVCTTLFYGYGFGLFGQINRTGLAAIVLTIWIAQLLISPIWLKHFRFGPAEWLWRSLTYWKIQPM
ncbi:hypothetical protein OJF2_73510 [Aquisphaera giovannonii]|uniref:DUF418 domain-containing protein n=1 Tax=Aquisphaera giovannonii TaxID=406548 RepID=A0A5B9WFA6_9BACT|nr:DUF418 domain-containing protein [Aquisphaera giovannonii]QEH38745.1 hypothetical protein OJF2_73510 [Aquisphaera giovannonii]